MQRSTTLILGGGLLVGVGLGLVQAGIRAGAPCIDCEPEGPEAVINSVAEASAEMNRADGNTVGDDSAPIE